MPDSTDIMARRLMEQLRSFPPGQARTAKDIARGMDGKLNASDIEPTLRQLVRAGWAVFEPGKPGKWRRADL